MLPAMRSIPLQQVLLRASFALFVTLNFCCVHATAAVNHSTPTCCVSKRPRDTIWMVSTRAFPCGDPRLHAQELSYRVLEQGQWQATDLAAFLATDDPRVTTIIWIHGNRYEPSDAHNHGLATYRALIKCITCDTPLRFVIFSWPSQRIDGSLVDDVRVKAARSNPNGYYLAWLLDQIGNDVPVSLIGYSYGARIAMGGLHLLGGGQLCGWTLDQRTHPDRQPVQVTLVAAAMDNHWLIPGHRHGNALSQVEHLTNIYNSCDRALRRYRYLYCHGSNAQAMGYTGIAGRNTLGVDRAKIQQFDACCYVGKEHGWENYLPSGPVMARMRANSLPQAPEAVIP